MSATEPPPAGATPPIDPTFANVLDAVGAGGRSHHEARMLEHAADNVAHQRRTLRDLPPLAARKLRSAIVVSGGPSLARRDSIARIRDARYDGAIIAVDASLAACLRQGLIPDYVLTLDPHPTRIVRWFGDHHWEEHARGDDYYERQELDVAFRHDAARRNRQTIELVDAHGSRLSAIVASCTPPAVRERLREAGADIYWWNPLVDNPREAGSLTRKLYAINKAPAMNTGGNVGTSAWVFATSILGIEKVGLVGMDMGYYADTPYEQTQLYYEYVEHLGGARDIAKCFRHVTFPTTNASHYTDPTYHWYAQNLIRLNRLVSATTYNCTEGGALLHASIPCVGLDDFFEEAQ